MSDSIPEPTGSSVCVEYPQASRELFWLFLMPLPIGIQIHPRVQEKSCLHTTPSFCPSQLSLHSSFACPNLLFFLQLGSKSHACKERLKVTESLCLWPSAQLSPSKHPMTKTTGRSLQHFLNTWQGVLITSCPSPDTTNLHLVLPCFPASRQESVKSNSVLCEWVPCHKVKRKNHQGEVIWMTLLE